MTIKPLIAIRKHCLWCCVGSAKVVEECSVKDCSLSPLRFGKAVKGYSILKAIKTRCKECGEPTMQAVKKCEFEKECVLYPFRTGINPALRGKRGKGLRYGTKFSKASPVVAI